MMRFKLLKAAIIGFLILVAIPVFGQFDFINSSTGEAVKITVLPKYPGPFENVRITIEDFGRDIRSIPISWSVNGKIQKQGTGVTSFDFTTGALGSLSKVTVSAGGISRTVTITPAAIDLMWQASSYTPPFYRGKALHSNLGEITVTAEPFFLSSNGVRLDPNKLIYKWKEGGTVIQNSSGYGRRTFRTITSLLAKPVDIEVEVSSQDGVYNGVGVVNIEEVRPEVVVYETKPTYGILDQKALDKNSLEVLAGQDISLSAIPFYFSTATKNSGAIEYTWTQNGRHIGQKNNTVFFTAPVKAVGNSSVSVATNHLTNFMQSDATSFSINIKTE